MQKNRLKTKPRHLELVRFEPGMEERSVPFEEIEDKYLRPPSWTWKVKCLFWRMKIKTSLLFGGIKRWIKEK